MSDIEELLEQIKELKTALEQVADERKRRAAGPPFMIGGPFDRLVGFTPESAVAGTVVLVNMSEYMCVGDHWIDFDGDVVRHDELTRHIRDTLAAERDVTLLHRG